MYNQAYSQVGYTQQANYKIRGNYKSSINIDALYRGLRGVYGVVNIDKELNHYSTSYSFIGYSQPFEMVYDDSFKSEVISDSKYNGFRYIIINYKSNVNIESNTTSESFGIIEDQSKGLLELESNYNPLNIVLGEGKPNVTFTTSYTQVMRLISSIIKRVNYNNYNQPYSSLGYSQTKGVTRVYNTKARANVESSFDSLALTSDNFISELELNSTSKPINVTFSSYISNIDLGSLSNNEVFAIVEGNYYSNIIINSYFLPYIGGRLIFKGKIFSQDIDTGTI